MTSDDLRAELASRLRQPDLDHVELTVGPAQSDQPGLRLRIEVVAAGQLFYWISFIATTDAAFDVASGARAAMRSFPWTMPFVPKLERPRATLPVLCRWQRAYAEDTATLCLTLLSKHFRVPLDSVQLSGQPAGGQGGPGGQVAPASGADAPPPQDAAKPQKVWLREITAWYLQPGP